MIAPAFASMHALVVATTAVGAVQDSARALRGVVVDAVTGAPVLAASVAAADRRTLTDDAGRFVLRARVGDTLRVRRVGYRALWIVVDTTPQPTVRLVPSAARLARVDVSAHTDDREAAGRIDATVTAAGARRLGAATLSDAIATLPFVAARAAQGTTSISLRGARPEQVVVTLDGMPVNDPATGRAELADVPLAALGAVSAVPGADPLGAGPGAVGGVLALTTASRATLAATVGSFGQAQVDGAGRVPLAGGSVRAGASLRTARNDFAFVNREGATGSDSVERRVNADERRAAVFASAVLPRAQLLLLASASDRGMSGPMNVRAYDEDRGRAARVALRAAVPLGASLVATSARAFHSAYVDPHAGAPDSRATTVSADVDVSRGVGALGLRAGVGGDRVTATSVRGEARGRAFASASWAAEVRGWSLGLGARGDAVGAAGARLSPSAVVERGVGGAGDAAPVTIHARATQAFRAPTLYDLYFASPQRLLARPLRPERVTLDAELGLRWRVGPVHGGGAVFARRTRDAIVWFPGNFGWSPANVGRERVRGAEARASLDSIATPLGRVALQGWGAAYDARLLADALVIPTPYVPRASGGGVAELRRGALSLAATVQALGRRPFADAPADRRYELPGVALVGLRASHSQRLGAHRTLLVVAVDNVGDVEWQSVRRFPTPGRSWSLGLTLDP